MYFDCLLNLVLSGKFRQVKIPHAILDKIINYFRRKDVQMLEQAILNLSLNKYPRKEELRQVCEEECLSSALIHVMTTIFQDENESDSTACLSILCSLFNIMQRAKKDKGTQDVFALLEYLERFGNSIFELDAEDAAKWKEEKKRKLFTLARNQKIAVEHSSVYIGYKIFWIVTLYLEGKMFPQGNLSVKRWRYYVMDIVRFFTNEQFMQWFLDFDPDSFFAILKKVFTEPEPFEYIITQDAFLESNKMENPHLLPCYTHSDILMIFEQRINMKIE